MSPRREPGMKRTWYWCRKNHVWLLHDCKHSKCGSAPGELKYQEDKPDRAPAGERPAE